MSVCERKLDKLNWVTRLQTCHQHIWHLPLIDQSPNLWREETKEATATFNTVSRFRSAAGDYFHYQFIFQITLPNLVFKMSEYCENGYRKFLKAMKPLVFIQPTVQDPPNTINIRSRKTKTSSVASHLQLISSLNSPISHMCLKQLYKLHSIRPPLPSPTSKNKL